MTVRVVGPRTQHYYRDAHWQAKHGITSIINTTSKGGWSSDFSPFKLGPCRVKPFSSYEESLVLENAWQYSKVYAQHLDSKGCLRKGRWLQWAKEGWHNPKAVRYPMGRGAKPEYSLWNGSALSYVEARKKIYIPLYAKLVVATAGFKKLQRLYKSEETIVLWDFDGYDHVREKKTLEQVVNDPLKKMGHAFVLAMLLERHPIVQKYLR